MTLLFVIDNQEHRLSEVLNDLLARSASRPLDIATAYFAVFPATVILPSAERTASHR